MHFTRGRLSAYTVYLIFSGAISLFLSLIFTVNMLYQVEVAKLNPLQLVLVGTTLEMVCFISQVPTGVLADMYSRRLSIIVGTLILGAGFMLEGSIPNFYAIAIGQSFFGIGATFIDGAEQAWITDEVGEENVGPVFLRITQVSLIAGLIGTGISVPLASIRLNLPIVTGGGLIMLLTAFLIFFMPERGFKPVSREEHQSWRTFGRTFRDGFHIVRLSTVLLTIMAIELFYGLSSEGYDRLSTAHLLANFHFPTFSFINQVAWFGLFSIAGTLLSLGATEIVKRRLDTNNHRIVVRVLFMMNALMVAAVLVFALAGNFFMAVGAFLAYRTFRDAGRPIFMTWLTQNIDAKVRATVISINGQINALGQIVGGPPVGYIGVVSSLRAALVAVSIILSPVLLLFIYASRKLKPTPVKADCED